MLHSPKTALVGTACSFHQKILKCSWDFLPQEERDLVAPIKGGYSNGKQEKLSKKGHVKDTEKPLPQTPIFSLGSSIFLPLSETTTPLITNLGNSSNVTSTHPMAVQNPRHLQTVYTSLLAQERACRIPYLLTCRF